MEFDCHQVSHSLGRKIVKGKTRIRYIYIATLVVQVSMSFVRVAEQEQVDAWTFVSMPDFLNVDTTYPQPGWEETLDYVLKAVKAENRDFLLVAGDLVMGRWWGEEKIEKYAAMTKRTIQRNKLSFLFVRNY